MTISSEKSKTVYNALITLGDTDDSGKGKHFKSRFFKDGLVNVEQFGTVFIKKENLDKFINTMVGVPVIINHKDITVDNADDERVGVVNSVWYNEEDGWYWCDGIIWDDTAQNLITDKGWSVSCSYDVKVANDEGGSENNIKYDIEFLDAVFTHLALVNNPRYERANIVFNSKTVIENGGQGSGNFGHAGRPGQVGGSSSNNVIDLSNYFNTTPTMEDVKTFLNEMVKQGKEFATSSPDWFVDIPASSKKKAHIAKSSQYQRMNKSQRNRHNKYILALEDLLGSAQYTNTSPNKKPQEKPNTQQYHYFNTEAKIGDKTYKIVFDTEEYKGDSTLKPQTVHLYDVREIKNSSLSANVLRSVKNLKEESTNIINNISEDFNPNVKESEQMEINNGWITKYDEDGNPYHVNIEGYNEESDKKDDKGNIETKLTELRKKIQQFRAPENGDLSELRKMKSDYQELLKKLDEKDDKKDSGYKIPDDYKKSDKKDDKKKPFKIPSITESLKKDYEDGKITAGEVAKELSRANLTPYLFDDKEALEKIGIKEDKKVSDTKIIEGGIKESTDKYGRTKFTKGNKWANVSSNGGRSDSWIAAYGLSHPSGVSWEREKGITEEQLLHSKGFKTEKGARKWALEQLKRISNDKEQTMEIIEKLKALIFSVENEKEYQMEVNNEKVDKRKLIDEVAGIMKSAGCDDEDIRTAIGKMEKIGYDKSEADTADNKKEYKNEKDDKVENKCKVKNEDEEDKKEVKEVKEEVKKDVENKCKNSIDNSKPDYFNKLSEIYNSISSSKKEEVSYVSRADREKAADDYFRN